MRNQFRVGTWGYSCFKAVATIPSSLVDTEEAGYCPSNVLNGDFVFDFANYVGHFS